MKPKTRENICRMLNINTSPVMKVNDKVMTFSRMRIKDIDAIEKMGNVELIKAWKSFVYCVEIYGQVSVTDCQMLMILDAELDDRDDIIGAPLKEWYDASKKRYEEVKSEL